MQISLTSSAARQQTVAQCTICGRVYYGAAALLLQTTTAAAAAAAAAVVLQLSLYRAYKRLFAVGAAEASTRRFDCCYRASYASPVLAVVILSVRPSVRPSVRQARAL